LTLPLHHPCLPGDATLNFGYSNKCFFSTSKSASGAWWFVDPNGDPFFSLGVCAVTYAGYPSTNGTASSHEDEVIESTKRTGGWLKDLLNSKRVSAHRTGSTPYLEATKVKFNNNQSAWADSAVARLDSWNFNTLGAWSDSVVTTKGMPWTRDLQLAKGYSRWLNGLFPDVFDPVWEDMALSKAKSLCLPVRNDPTLLGYFIDNEVTPPPPDP
jgi:agarase